MISLELGREKKNLWKLGYSKGKLKGEVNG